MIALWRLIRPFNCFMAALSVGLGYFSARVFSFGFPSRDLALIMGSAFLITGFGNANNDILDREIDAVNRPGRPLPSGAISHRTALWFSSLFCLSGLACARAVSLRFFLMASGVTLLLWLYNGWFKRTVLLGNVVVSFLTGFTLLYGGFLADAWVLAVWPALFAFLLNLAREIIKDMADVQGDLAGGCVTLPIRYGSLWAANIAALALIGVIFLVPRPFFAGLFNGLYLMLAELGVVVPAFAVILLLFRNRENPRMLNRLAAVLKVMMFIGLVAVLFGKRSM